MLTTVMMKKYLICTPGRTASTSLFNYVRGSLYEQSANVFAVDRGAYTEEELSKFNQYEYAAFTMFNPFKFPFILKDINPEEWCLIVLSRHDLASWLLSMISIHSTGEWHPGKDTHVTSFKTRKEEFLSSYWYYYCWTNLIEKQADTFGFGKVIRIDFDELTNGWEKTGQIINPAWSWPEDKNKMKLGMTTSWSAVEDIKTVLSWIPSEDTQLLEAIKQTL
jgi:hypothetical protein